MNGLCWMGEVREESIPSYMKSGATSRDLHVNNFRSRQTQFRSRLEREREREREQMKESKEQNGAAERELVSNEQ